MPTPAPDHPWRRPAVRVCARPRRPRAEQRTCVVCRCRLTGRWYLCDGPGRRPGTTCDVPMCGRCRVRPDPACPQDYCPRCLAAATSKEPV
jgi:hypothetical protein